VPSVLTAPVQKTVLSSVIVTRGDVKLADAELIKIDSDLGDQPAAGAVPIVTKLPPPKGSVVKEGSVLATVSGRPILLLEGVLPMYRRIIPGVSGPDVKQLEAALDRLGFQPGKLDGVYDAGTQRAVARFYRSAGYNSVGPTSDESAQLSSATDQLRAAEQALSAARLALRQAEAGPSKPELLAARVAVNAAERALANAKATRREAVSAADPGDRARVLREQNALVADATDALALARAQQDQLMVRGTSVERQAVQAAEANVVAAQRSLVALSARTGVSVPQGEIVFVHKLPRQVADVPARLGKEPSGGLVSLASSETVVLAALTSADLEQVRVGSTARLTDSDDGDLGAGVVTKINSEGEEVTAEISPPSDFTGSLGSNIKVTLAVESTEQSVLVVPLGAVSTDGSGSSTVAVRNASGETRTVKVKLGLVAQGLAEVTPIGGALAPGDEVVLGLRAGS
jgi:peptidoglycan hydrolase-like protein with peptidoglycan-binding domain